MFKIEDLDEIKPGDIIKITFNSEEVCYEDISLYHNEIKNMFPNNMVISIPDIINLTSLTKEDLNPLIESLIKLKNEL